MGKKIRCEWVTKIEKKPQGRFSIPALLPKNCISFAAFGKKQAFLLLIFMPYPQTTSMKRNAALTFSCLLAFFLSIPTLYAQSLYQDALDLAKIMQQNQSQQVGDSLWMRLAHSVPFIISENGFSEQSFDTIHSVNENDYLIVNKGAYPDELILYRASTPDSILFATPVKYDYCILRLRKGEEQDKLTLVSPSGETLATYSNTALIGADLVISNRQPGNFHFYESDRFILDGADPFRPDHFSNDRKRLPKRAFCEFPSIPEGDTLLLKSNGKVLFKVFNHKIEDKLIFHFFLDSIFLEIDGGDFLVEKQDSIEVESVPFTLYAVDQFLSEDNSFLVLFIPQKGAYMLEREKDKVYELEIAQPERKIGEFFSRKFNPDHIPLSAADRRILLSRQCDYHFDQITLYSGSRLLNTIHLKRPKVLESITFNERTNSIDFSVTRDIRPNETRYRNYRKKYQISSNANLSLAFLERRFDYSCSYASFMEDYLIQDRITGKGVLPVQVNAFSFELCKIRGEKDTTFQISQSDLAKMPLEENVLYMLQLDTTLAKQQLGLLDFSDMSFCFVFPDENKEPFRWYPALNPMIEVFVKDSIAHIFYAPALVTEHFSVPVFQEDSLAILLGTHSQLKEADLVSPHLWGDISEKYRNNPFLAKYLKNRLAHTRFDPAPGISNLLLRAAISAQLETWFAWQKIIFGNESLQSEDQVAYDELVSTYRTRVPTASDKLQVASEQFNNETQKLRRGLNAADLAAGLSDFIVERAQEELNLSFLNRLRDRIQQDSEFIVLFPQTVKMMADFKIEQYRTLLDFAKNAFVQDLRNLGVTFPRLFSMLSKYQQLQNDPKVYNLFLLYDIANKVYEGTPVENVLLHVHSRLKERRKGLEEAIHKELGIKLVRDAATQQQFSNYVLNYGRALEYYYAQASTLDSTFMVNWHRLSDKMKEDGSDEEVLRQMKALRAGSEIVDETDERRKDSYPDDSDSTRTTRFDQYLFVSDNLQGNPGYEYLRKNLEFNRFRAFFSQKPDSSRTISLGLAQADVLLSVEHIRNIEVTVREMEDKISTLQTLGDALESRRAKTANSLSGYLPLLKKYKSLMVQRACLELALTSELAYHTQSGQHNIESLHYLKGVLWMPHQFGLYDWTKLDAFGRSLRQVGLIKGKLQTSASLYEGAEFFGEDKPLNLYEGYKLLSVVSSDAGEIEAEIERAGAFLESMASTMRDHFPLIAASRSVDATQKDSLHYRNFLYSSYMTDAALVLDYSGLMQQMHEQISGPSRPVENAAKSLTREEISIYESQAAHQIIKPLVPSGNQFLDYYDQTVPYESFLDAGALASSHNAGLAKEVESVRASIAELKRTSSDYHQFLEKLKVDSTAAPLAALRHAAQFDTLVSVTLLWMHAFRNNAAAGDSSVIVRDTVVVHKKMLSKSGVEITYDSIWIIPRVKGASQWMTLQQFNEVMDDTLQRKIFLGLLYQRLSAVEGGLHYSTPNLALLATKFMNTVYEIDDARAILHYKKEHNNALGFEDYYPFIRSIVDMLNVVLETPLGSGEQPLNERLSQLSDLPDISNESLSLFENIFAENYGSAIRNVVQLLSITWGLRQKDKTGLISNLKKDKRRSSVKSSFEMTSDAKSDRRGNEKIKSAVLTYGTFMANMVEAETPDQVKAAISAVAVPPGSSSLKRNARLNVGVNGYFGLGFHRETLTSDSLAGNLRKSGAFGLSVPVGIALSMGQLQIGKREQSFSLFIPVLDLGAVTTYRINQKDLPSDLPKLSFGNLISPGAYLLWNIRKSPFTIGGGAQFGPQLRQVTVDGKRISSSAWRYGLTFAIDVPIFNLYTQQEQELRKRKR